MPPPDAAALAAILESFGVGAAPAGGGGDDDVVRRFETFLGLVDDVDDGGPTFEDCTPVRGETVGLVRDWLKGTWNPREATTVLAHSNAFLESDLSPEEISLEQVWASVRVTRWMVHWIELTVDGAGGGGEAPGNDAAADDDERDIFWYLLRSGDGILHALFQYIQNLPLLQSQMHLYTRQLQKATRAAAASGGTQELSDPQPRLRQYALAQAVAQRLQVEWDRHMEDLQLVCGDVYRQSDAAQRRTGRRLLGQVWGQFILASSGAGGGLRQENTRAAGIQLTLQVLYRILLGVSEIREPHEQLLTQLLIPLHKPDAMVLWRDQVSILEVYHEPLVKCIAVILQKKRSLIARAILDLVHADVFPLVGNTPKQVLLLHEIDTYLGLIMDEDEECTVIWLTTFLTVVKRCMTSDHSRVAERALEFFKNKSFQRIIAARFQLSLEILLPALVRSQPSWNPTVKKMTYYVLKNLHEQNERLFEEVANRLFADQSKEEAQADADKAIVPSTTASQISSMRPEPAMKSDTSLKAGMGGWKPPGHPATAGLPRDSRYRMSSERGASPRTQVTGAQPPLTVTGVAPWSTQASKNPPLTVTGVAPWALKPSGTKSDAILKRKSPAAPSSVQNVPLTGLEYVQQYMSTIKPKEEESGASSWSKSQMAETPTLLPELKFHDLVFGHDLGSGAFGQVRYARLIDKTKTRSFWPEYAVKVISTEKIRELGYETSVQREIAVLRILSHPGIARLVSSFRFHDGAYLVLEYASRGDLHSLLRKHGSLDHQSTRFVMGSIVAALTSIHDMGLVYGDLKAENVLITETGHIKITDFGGCRPFTSEAKALIQSISKDLLKKLRDGDWKLKKEEKHDIGEVTDASKIDHDYDEEDDRIEGTTSYLPPEVVMGAVPTSHADVWALGCLTYQCLTGRPPFYEADDETTRQTIVNFNIQASTSDDPLFRDKHATFIDPEARTLIKACLRRDLSQRPGMDELARYEFFSEVDVFSLHSQPAYPLDVGDVAPSPNAQWSRRQFSSIWSRHPTAYDIKLPDDSSTSNSFARSDKLQPIIEGDEAMGYFTVSQQAVKTLGKISERLPPSDA